MRTSLTFMLLLGLGVLCPKSYGARFSFTLSGQSNIFGAGRTNPLPVPSGVFEPSRWNSGQGVAPTPITVDPAMPATPPPYVVLSFPSITGSGVWYDVNPPASTPWSSPDGIPIDLDTNLSSLNGISGFSRTRSIMFIVGVFLGPTAPSGAAPPSLNFDTANTTAEFRPLLGQTFFIGDGRTAAGDTQRFWVPAGATRLHLGFGDGMLFSGVPSYFDDNRGSFNITGSFDPSGVPEPASLGLALLGVAAIMWKARRRSHA